MSEAKRRIITKFFQPEGEYASSLRFLPRYDEAREVLATTVPIEAGPLTDEEALEVERRPHVVSVEDDVLDGALAAPGAEGFDRGPLEYHELFAAAKEGAGGQGSKVAVLDTGIKKRTLEGHFRGRAKLAGARNFTTDADVYDPSEHSHGDFCCVAACPEDARLLVGKVLRTSDGLGYRSWIIAGMQWAIESGAHAISMSLGSTSRSDAYDAILARCKDLGIPVFAAAGNGGREGESVNWPAASSNAYAVAAIDHNAEVVANFSCKGPEVDLAAAGVAVRYDDYDWYGTSMATPLAANAYIRILSKANDDPLVAIKALFAGLVDTHEPIQAEGQGVVKCVRSLRTLDLPTQPKPEEPPKPELPRHSLSRYVTGGYREPCIVTKGHKRVPVAKSEPI